MCRHNKKEYESYGVALQVCKRKTKTERWLGQSVSRPLQPYSCPECRQWFVFRPVRRRKGAHPYCRSRELRWTRRLIERYV